MDNITNKNCIARKLLLLICMALVSNANAKENTYDKRLTNAKQLTKDAEGAFWPRFSPDGKQIVYYTKRDGVRQIFVMDADGSKKRQLTSGKHDNRDPSWSPDGKRIIWSSNKSGNYDIWMMTREGKDPKRLTKSKSNEYRPRFSPIQFRLQAMGAEPVDPIFGGVGGPDFGPYYRILYQKGLGKRASIWSMWDDGRFPVQVSKKGHRARHAEWAPDGLSIAYDVETKNGSVIYIGTNTVSEKVYQYQNLPDNLSNEELLLKLPKEFVSYASKQLTRPEDNFSRPAFFANNTGMYAVKTKSENKNKHDIYEIDLETGEGKSTITNDSVAFAPSWSPVGDKIAFTVFEDDISQIMTTSSEYYLSDVLNLYMYPELLKSQPVKLNNNKFVITKNKEAEFFHLLEKVRYQKKGVFISTDPLMQLFHDMFEGVLTHIERNHLHAELASLSTEMYKQSLDKLKKSSRNNKKAWRDAVVYFGVPMLILEPGSNLINSLPVSPAIKNEIHGKVSMVKNHSGQLRNVDFSQFKVRGHYDDNGALADYFRAMMWFGQVSFEENKTFGLVYRLLKQSDNYRYWESIYTITSYFAGTSEDPTFQDIASAEKNNPAISKMRPEQLVAAVFKNSKNRIADSSLVTVFETNSAGQGFSKKYKFFPQRYSLDADILQSVTVPKLPGREFPSSLDVLSSLGSDRAMKHLHDKNYVGPAVVPDGNAHAAAIKAMRGAVDKAGKKYWKQNLYNGWLYALKLLQHDMRNYSSKNYRVPAFMNSDIWIDKQLVTASGSYAELKHDTILYSKQPYAAEGAEGGEVTYFLEHEIQKKPKGYVEPNIELYRWLKELANELGKVARKSGYSDSRYGDQVNVVVSKAASMLDQLIVISRKIAEGRSIEQDYAWIDRFGATLESYYVLSMTGGGSLMERSGDRLENGIKIIADVFTNLNSQEVLEVAVGDVNNLYVITDHSDGKYLTQGGVFSYYEFKHPMNDRLSDKQWAEKVNSGNVPGDPLWIKNIMH